AKPPVEAAKPPTESTKPPVEADKPSFEAIKPPVETVIPLAEVAKSPAKAVKPTSKVVKPPVEMTKPLAEMTNLPVEVAKALAEVAKPSAEKSPTKAVKPLTEVAKPPAEKSPAKAVKPPSKAVKPPVEMAKPQAEVVKPLATTTNLMVEAAKPLAEMTNLMIEVTKPLAEITNSSTETTRALIEENILSNETDALLAEAMEILAKAADPQQPSDLGPRPQCGTSIKQNIADSSESLDVTSVGTSLNLLETSLNNPLVSPLHESLHDVTSVEEITSWASEDSTAVPDTLLPLLAAADKDKPINKINVPQSTVDSRFQNVYEVTGSESDNNEPSPVAVLLSDSEVKEKLTSPEPNDGKVDSIREEKVPEVSTCGKGSKSEVKPIANGHITAVPVTSVAPNKPVAHDKKVKKAQLSSRLASVFVRACARDI
ncbi:unnamed protein product, partial [Timema podura]|nr:unnamed protein product [Timema podura]